MYDNRKDAKLNGDKFYFTGKPCKHGHLDKRQVSNGCCYTCSKGRCKVYADENKGKRRKYRRENADRIREVSKTYYIENKDKRREYRRENADKIAVQVKKYQSENNDTITEYKKKWYSENKDKYIEYSRKRYARVKDDPDFKITKVMREMVKRSLNGTPKTSRTTSLLGYDSDYLMQHLESQFVEGMSWDNYGEWHIDHIIPISWWISQGIKDAYIINSLDNLQPLWAKDNLSKGAKV